MDVQWIFSEQIPFAERALRVFRHQAKNNPVYKRYLEAINCDPLKVATPHDIPFLPIELFKSREVVSGIFDPQTIFESSGTTGSVNSRHYIKDLAIYEQSFGAAFCHFYGAPDQYCVLGLLPSYLERGSSSLVYMVQHLIRESGHPRSGFYLYDFDALADTLQQVKQSGKKILLIGVTYALLDFAAAHPMNLGNAIVMETGGMKGRKQELLRTEVHALLRDAFQLEGIHSEYGMTELLSQAYAHRDGLFETPHWMQVLLREEDDPFALHFASGQTRTGALNVIDLANIHSCSFIATEDVARLHPGGKFEVLGRMDHSDVRGCSLLAL